MGRLGYANGLCIILFLRSNLPQVQLVVSATVATGSAIVSSDDIARSTGGFDFWQYLDLCSKAVFRLLLREVSFLGFFDFAE